MNIDDDIVELIGNPEKRHESLRVATIFLRLTISNNDEDGRSGKPTTPELNFAVSAIIHLPKDEYYIIRRDALSDISAVRDALVNGFSPEETADALADLEDRRQARKR